MVLARAAVPATATIAAPTVSHLNFGVIIRSILNNAYPPERSNARGNARKLLLNEKTSNNMARLWQSSVRIPAS